MNFYKILNLITSVLFAYLFSQLMFAPESFIRGVGVEPCLSATILARRASIFMLGIVLLMFGSRNMAPSKARQILCFSTAVTMLGLACIGSFELIRGTVNSSMIQAMIIESVIGISYIVLLIKHRNVSDLLIVK
jgi:hypothetical protein